MDNTADQQQAGGAGQAGQPPTTEEIRALLADLIGISPDDIADDANLIRLGLGSQQLMRLATRWRRAGFAVSFAQLAEDPTCAAWSRRLNGAAVSG